MTLLISYLFFVLLFTGLALGLYFSLRFVKLI